MLNVIDEFLKINKDEKIEICLEDFFNSVIEEMTENSQNFSNRQSFLLFFRSNMLNIRENMYEEFKDHITDTDFDLYIRKAISVYEGH